MVPSLGEPLDMGRKWGARSPIAGSIALIALLSSVALVLTGLPAASKGNSGCAPARHPGGDWPIYGHDLSNTRSQEKEKKIGLVEAATLQPAWHISSEELDGSGDFSGTPVVADGCLYVGSNDGWVFAVNADSGKLVWSANVKKGGINSSLAVDGGRVYATVSDVGKPYLVAFDQDNGDELWRTEIDNQPGSDVYSSPVVFGGMVFTGWSGGSAELGDEADRYPFQGGFVLVDARTGKLLEKTYTIRPPDKNPDKPKDLYAGGAIWSTPAVDLDQGYAYVGGGNPFRPQEEHKHTNAILKIDIDRSRSTFGAIVDHYKGTPDEYIPAFSDIPCYDIPGNPAPYYPQGIGQCGDLDMDFGASPNLWKEGGKTLVGEGQKSGIYHTVDASNMKRVWTAIVGPPSAVGGIVGSTALANDHIYGPITVPDYLWALDAPAGTPTWFAPVGDGAHWGNPVSEANGVVYTVDVKGFLNGYDSTTGAQVLAFPL